MGILTTEIGNVPGLGGGSVFYDEPLLHLPYEGNVPASGDLVIVDIDIPAGVNKMYFVWTTHHDVGNNSDPRPDVLVGRIWRAVDGSLRAASHDSIHNNFNAGAVFETDTPSAGQVRIAAHNESGVNDAYVNGVLLISAAQDSTQDLQGSL